MINKSWGPLCTCSKQEESRAGGSQEPCPSPARALPSATPAWTSGSALWSGVQWKLQTSKSHKNDTLMGNIMRFLTGVQSGATQAWVSSWRGDKVILLAAPSCASSSALSLGKAERLKKNSLSTGMGDRICGPFFFFFFSSLNHDYKQGRYSGFLVPKERTPVAPGMDNPPL